MENMYIYIYLYYIILYHIILYYIVLYYIILHYIILYYVILYYIISYYIILYYIYVCVYRLEWGTNGEIIENTCIYIYKHIHMDMYNQQDHRH